MFCLWSPSDHPINTGFIQKTTKKIFTLKRGPVVTSEPGQSEYKITLKHQFEIYQESKPYGTLKVHIIQNDNFGLRCGVWNLRLLYANDEYALISLLMFIGSKDLQLNGINYVYIEPPSSIDYFNFILSCGFIPKPEKFNFPALIDNMLSKPDSPFAPFIGISEMLENAKLEWNVKLAWQASTSMDWCSQTIKTSPALWSCPVVILLDNLQRNFDEWFDLESSL